MDSWRGGDLTSLPGPVEGERLEDRFVVHGLACVGGMGAIYRGSEESTGRPVAIKVFRSTPGPVSDRFLREARVLARLRHPRIVEHLAHGISAKGLPYLVMEWLDGEDLSARLARGRLTEIESLTLIRRVSEALASAHAQGVVHRDVKPANLFLEGKDTGAVKVLDFGVARLLRGATAPSTGSSLVGTVGYMAPEQVLCESDVDTRADVFAIGCVLYECLTGRAPFASAHPVGILAKVLREDPPGPSEVAASVDPRVDGLVRSLLAKRRRDRPADAAAVLVELDTFRERGPVPVPAVASPRSYSPRGEQRILSVILGRPSSQDAPRVSLDAQEQILGILSAKFACEVALLAGGGLLLVLAGRGHANDRACRAASCALELGAQRPDLMLAVATGLADTSGDIPVGDPIDRAAALLTSGRRPGARIAVDDVTAGLLGQRFELHRADQGTELLGPRRQLQVPGLLMGRPIPCFGRDRELAMLDAILGECLSDGVSRVVLITGAPGIGKSRLAAEWLGRRPPDGAVRALVAGADPGSGAAAFSLVQRLIRAASGLREADPRRVQHDRLCAYLSSVHGVSPEDIEILSELLGLQGDDEPSEAFRGARAAPEIFGEVVRGALQAWLDAELERTPLVLLLEDVHWADVPSVAFLTGAARTQPDRPLMLLAMTRPEAEPQLVDLCELAAVRIRMQGLTARSARLLVRAALDAAPDEDVVARIIQTADGNPFYLEELIRRVASGSSTWPNTVLAMAQSRMEQLDFPARWALRIASVFGERSWDRGVQEIMGPDHDSRELLGELASDELLVDSLESRFADSREYRFRHALLRDAAYGMMTEADRRECHGLVGSWLEGRGETQYLVLADHFEAAGLVGRACPWLVRAARAAIDAGDLATTIACAERGVRLGASGVERGRLLLARAYAATQQGDPDFDAAREALSLVPVGTAPWWLGLATLIVGLGMHGRSEELAPFVALAAEAPFVNDRAVPFGQGLVTLVGGLVLFGKEDVAAVVVERVAGAAPSAAEDPVFDAFLASARCALASVAPVSGKWRLEGALLGGRKVVEAFRHMAAVHGESVALYYLAIAAIHLGLYDEARSACQRSVELTQRVSSINDGWPRLLWARALLRLGLADEAIRVVEALRSSPNRIVRHMLPVVVAEARLRQGRLAEAADEARPACAGLSTRLRRLAACVLARAELLQGRPGLALEVVTLGLGKETSQGLETDIDLLTLRAETLHLQGRQAEAVAALGEACDYLLAIASEIADPLLRASFLENVEPCARALDLRARWGLPAA